MSFAGLCNKTATIRRATIDAATGPEPRSNWTDTGTCRGRLDMCNYAQQVVGGKGVAITGAAVATPVFFAPFTADITERDRLVIDAVEYEVQQVNPDAGGRGHHKELQLRVAR